MWNIFIQNYFACLIALWGFYSMGLGVSILFKINIKNAYISLFAQLLIGLILFVFFTSIFFTDWRTINLGFILLFISFVIVYYKSYFKTTFSVKEILKNHRNLLLIELPLITLIIFAIKFYTVYNPYGTIPALPKGDYICYANISSFLVETGKENISADYLFPTQTGASPYHYFEIWINAGIMSLFNLNPLLTFYLITFVIGPSILWVGLCGLLSHFKNNNSLNKILACSFLFVGGIIFPFYTKIPFMNGIAMFSPSALLLCKYFPIMLFLLASLLFFLNNKYTYGILVLFCLPIVSITTAISIFAGGSIFILIHYWYYKNKTILYSFILIFLLAIFILLFYTVFNFQTSSHIPTNPTDMANRVSLFFKLKTFINIIGASIIQTIIVFLPTIILAAFIFRKIKVSTFIKTNFFVLLAILIFIFSLLSWAILHPLNETLQLFLLVGPLICTIISMVVYAYCILQETAKLKFAATLLLIVTVIINFKEVVNFNKSEKYSMKFLKQVEQLPKSESKIGVEMVSEVDYREFTYGYVSNNALLGLYLSYLKPDISLIDISIIDYPFSQDERIHSVEYHGVISCPFYKYAEKYKKGEKYIKSTTDIRLDFIKEYKIKYLNSL